MTSFDTPELPRRTWQQWWRELPGYWRIAGWTVGVLAVLHGLLAIRLWIGEIEPLEVRALRKPGQFVDVDYRAIPLPIRDSRVHWWLRRLFWRSRFEVIGLTCGPGTTDAELDRICLDFPNLTGLRIRDGEFQPGGLKPLARLNDLQALSLIDSNVNDEMVGELADVPQLTQLTLDGTYVSDDVGGVLAEIASLKSVSVRFTDVSPAAAKSWSTGTPTSPLKLYVNYEWNRGPIMYGFRFRWSDGRQSYGILRQGICTIEGKDQEGDPRKFDSEIWWGYIHGQFADLLQQAAEHLEGDCAATIRRD